MSRLAGESGISSNTAASGRTGSPASRLLQVLRNAASGVSPAYAVWNAETLV